MSCLVSQLTVVAQTSVWLYRVIMSEVLVGCPYTFCSSFLVPAAGSIFFFFFSFFFFFFVFLSFSPPSFAFRFLIFGLLSPMFFAAFSVSVCTLLSSHLRFFSFSFWVIPRLLSPAIQTSAYYVVAYLISMKKNMKNNLPASLSRNKTPQLYCCPNQLLAILRRYLIHYSRRVACQLPASAAKLTATL